jgi:hypothetical protein
MNSALDVRRVVEAYTSTGNPVSRENAVQLLTGEGNGIYLSIIYNLSCGKPKLPFTEQETGRMRDLVFETYRRTNMPPHIISPFFEQVLLCRK